MRHGSITSQRRARHQRSRHPVRPEVRTRRRHDVLVVLLQFSAIAAVGMGIALSCPYVSRSVLGHESPSADNIAANVIGLGLATTFRFLMYRYWVYGDQRSNRVVTADIRNPVTAAPDSPAAH